jgi:hypothetical protein
VTVYGGHRRGADRDEHDQGGARPRLVHSARPAAHQAAVFGRGTLLWHCLAGACRSCGALYGPASCRSPYCRRRISDRDRASRPHSYSTRAAEPPISASTSSAGWPT